MIARPSSDAAQQSAASSLASFATLPDEADDPDADGDGVPDAIDRCPNTPADDHVDAKGCSLSCPRAVHKKHHRHHGHHRHDRHSREPKHAQRHSRR